MPDVVAKAMAVITGLLLVMTVAVLVVTSRPSSDKRQVVAEFRDAFPALEGMQVRTDGAAAGSTGKITVTKDGLAAITLLVDKDVPAPRADASATIRQLDSTGDSYIAYDPGKAAEPLKERDGKLTIACDAPTPTAPCTNTLAAPRLDDLINAFGPPEQAGVKLILEELSRAVDQRGGDLNRAALRLVPALDAANTALGEVNSQNRALKSMITDLQAVAGQGASRKAELARLIGSLERTLGATAASTRPLDAGLEKLPEAQRAARTTLASLTRAANAGRPLGRQLSAVAPGLQTLLQRTPSFLQDVRFAVRQARPTLELTRQLLVAAAPAIAADPQRVVTGAFDLAPALSNLLKGILGGDETIRGLFGDDKDGGAEDRKGFGFGLGAVTSDPGTYSDAPAGYRDRNFIRVTAGVTCQSFGVAVRPGCLTDLLAARDRAAARKAPKTPLGTPKRPGTRKPGGRPAVPSRPALPTPAGPVGDVLQGVQKTVDGLLDPVKPQQDGAPAGSSLLDFLLRP